MQPALHFGTPDRCCPTPAHAPRTPLCNGDSQRIRPSVATVADAKGAAVVRLCVAKWGVVGYIPTRVEAKDRGGEAPPTSSPRSKNLPVPASAERTDESGGIPGHL